MSQLTPHKPDASASNEHVPIGFMNAYLSKCERCYLELQQSSTDQTSPELVAVAALMALDEVFDEAAPVATSAPEISVELISEMDYFTRFFSDSFVNRRWPQVLTNSDLQLAASEAMVAALLELGMKPESVGSLIDDHHRRRAVLNGLIEQAQELQLD